MIATYFDRLLKAQNSLLTEANAGPFEHLGFLGKVRNTELLVLGQEGAIASRDKVINLVEEVFAAANPVESF